MATARGDPMATHLAFQPEERFLRVAMRGSFPSKTYRELLRAVLDQAEHFALARILLDCRGLSAPSSEMDRFNVGVAIADVFGGRYRIAILYPRELINKFTEDAAVNRGASVRVVSDEKQALQWLLGEAK
jgi:hypothetical protein